MVILALELKPPINSRKATLAVMESLRPATEASAGCVEYDVMVEANPTGPIHLRQLWECELDIQRYFHSAGFHKILELMESSEEPPKFRLFKVIESSGLDALGVENSESAEQQDK